MFVKSIVLKYPLVQFEILEEKKSDFWNTTVCPNSINPVITHTVLILLYDMGQDSGDKQYDKDACINLLTLV